MIIAASDPSFLRQPYEVRRNLQGWWNHLSYSYLESWIDHKNNGHRVPQLIPKQLFHLSREVLADVLSVFWSENEFFLRDAGVELLWLGNHVVLLVESSEYLYTWLPQG
jgi:hypothetical protein